MTSRGRVHAFAWPFRPFPARRAGTRALVVLVTLVATLIAAPAAGAATGTDNLIPKPPAGAQCATSPTGTVCNFDVQLSAADAPFGVTCPDGSQVLWTYTVDAHLTRFYDANGVLQQTIRHFVYTGTLTNAAGGTPVPFVGRYTSVVYYDGTPDVSPVRTVNTGAWMRVTTSHGSQIIAAGREIFDNMQGDFPFGAGPGMGADLAPSVCPLVR